MTSEHRLDRRNLQSLDKVYSGIDNQRMTPLIVDSEVIESQEMNKRSHHVSMPTTNVVIYGLPTGLRHLGRQCTHYKDPNPLEISEALWKDLTRSIDAVLRDTSNCNRWFQVAMAGIYLLSLVVMIFVKIPYHLLVFITLFMTIVFITVGVLTAQATFYLETLIEEEVFALLASSFEAEGYHVSITSEQTKYSGSTTYLRFSAMKTNYQRI